jgi:hypothetical protein
LSLAFALPAWHSLMQRIPGTILRSPARQIYLTTFALAIGAGVLIDVTVAHAQQKRWKWLAALVGIALIAHGLDLGYFHDRNFVIVVAVPTDQQQHDEKMLARDVGLQRVGIDYDSWLPYNRQLDDVGVFDSILLAKPYRALMELNTAPTNVNVQNIDAAQLLGRTNQFFGVARILTKHERSDLHELTSGGGMHFYEVANPLPRAALFAMPAAQYLSEQQIHQHLERADFNPFNQLLLPADAPKPPEGLPSTAPPSLTYEHPSSDEFVAKLNAPWPGYLRLLETWDPGWRATVDGSAAPVIRAYDTFVAIPVSPGVHEVRLTYHTPGLTTGLVLSGLSLLALGGLCWLEWSGRAKQRARSGIAS